MGVSGLSKESAWDLASREDKDFTLGLLGSNEFLRGISECCWRER